MKSQMKTSRVVGFMECNTMAKMGDLCARMERKLKNRFGRSTPFRLEQKIVSVGVPLSSASVLVTMQLEEGEVWEEYPSDGAVYDAKKKGIQLGPQAMFRGKLVS